MKRDWRPGDVASVLCSDGKWRTALHYLYMGRWTWAFGDSTFRDADTSEARPLVVIDPEDREQVEAVFRLVLKTLPRVGPTHRDYCDALQDALREFANPAPPKPEEPTGLGAVVEAINDNFFVRVGEAGWVHAGDASGEPQDWRDIAVVRVVREGVVADD